MTKNKHTSNEKALERFVGHIGEINGLLEELQTFFDDHMGYDPDSINWGHVGTASYFLQKLTELTNSAYKRGEDTE